MPNRKKTIYVIGHKNPDTDSIVSAIAYANLKQELGITNCFPARVGKINLQTEYILNRFSLPLPHFISDLNPRVRNFMITTPTVIDHNTPLWKALEILNKKNYKMLPIVNDEGTYLSSLHYNAFAQNMLKKIDPQKNSIISTSIDHLITTLNAQPMVVHKPKVMFKSQIIVAASNLDSVKEFINAMPPENSIVVVGDRTDVQEYVIEKKVRALIVSGGKVVPRELKKKAENSGVSILISPFDTSTASWLALYSTPVKNMGDKSIKPVGQDEYTRNITALLSESVSNSLSVVDDDNKVIGVVSQGDLMKDPNIEIIMVDHNEMTQAVDGIENFRILEIIDHHRLGNMHTPYPITFINKPVGSTSTIIATLYQDYKIPLTREIASILLAGILSDTLILRSATTTKVDVEMADYLSEITDLTIEEYGMDIMSAASLVGKKPASEIVTMDQKEYVENGISYSVSQVEVNSLTEVMDKKEKLLEALASLQDQKDLYFAALMVTDITRLNSILLIQGNRDFIQRISYPREENNVFTLKGILSRKKQLIPYFTELIKKSN